jgi:AGCS family alanine or glycine:cation symporter
MIQSGAMADAVEGVLGVPPLLTGGIAALLLCLVLRRGTEGVLRVTGILVPLMSVGFVVLSGAVLILRAEAIPAAFSSILSEAFRPSSAAGGVVGFLLSHGLRYGVMRGVISNEAGCGTAPIAHAAAESDLPARQGFFGILEVKYRIFS